MIPFIRSLSELMVMTESRDVRKNNSIKTSLNNSTIYSSQRKRYLKSIESKNVDIPDLPKIIRHKWRSNKESVSRFFDELDYNNQIQSSYDLTLLERQNNRHHQDAA